MKKYIMSFLEHVQFMLDQENENKPEPLYDRQISKIPGADNLDHELNARPLTPIYDDPKPKSEAHKIKDDLEKNKNKRLK